MNGAPLSLALGLLKTTPLLVPISLAHFAYESGITPLFGTVPTQGLINVVTLAAIATAIFFPPRSSSNFILAGTALLLTAAPTATYWTSVYTSRWHDPILGPAITHLTVLAPIVYLSTDLAMKIGLRPVLDEKFNESRLRFSHRVITAIVIQTVTTKMNSLWLAPLVAPYLNELSYSDVFLYLAGFSWTALLTLISLSLFASSSAKGPAQADRTLTRAKFLASIPPVFIYLWIYAFPVLRSPALHLVLPYTHPSYPLRILSSTQSVTGVVVVGEALRPSDADVDPSGMHSLRYLRASHSILGGVWIADRVTSMDDTPREVDLQGTPLGDSIYSTFVLQEAARLINSTKKEGAESWDNALIIGLGAGISATAFSQHNISTTILEIDPAVYDAAVRFFGLPEHESSKVFLEDGRKWISEKSANILKREAIETSQDAQDLFDIVVHDCFSGGGVPDHLFTMEFWRDLKIIMHPDGVVVINFAGRLDSDPARAVLVTLQESFGNCRAFHDSFEEVSEQNSQTVFLNMVFFCALSGEPITFRSPRDSDYLHSYLRKHILSSLPQREINLSLISSEIASDKREQFILTDKHNPLGKWQEAGALHHFKVMRDVLPDVFWETY